MDQLFGVVGNLKDPRMGGGDSFVDRLSNRYTVYVLMILAIMITTKNYAGHPISCFAPSHFSGKQVSGTQW